MTKADEIATGGTQYYLSTTLAKTYEYDGFGMERLEMKKIHLPIIIEIDEDGYYIVTYPLFKGCHSYGETIDEALENTREVIEICLEETRNFLNYNQEIYNVT